MEERKLRVLIIYYTQSGNTQKIARRIAAGAASAGAEVSVTRLKRASYEMLEDYDLIGLGSPVWKADTPNMHAFINKLPDQKGKHCFAFNTHGTLPHLYFPIVIPNLKNHGFLPIGYKGWYGDVNMPGMPKPYYTFGHPDEQDLAEAEAFGAEMVENSRRIAAGERELIYPDPEMNDKVFEQAMICSNMLLCPTNPQGAFLRDPEKCRYPKCHVCMDNCMMGYIDLSRNPPVFGNRGDRCDDCHECAYCFMICPFGAIYPQDPQQFERDRGVRHENFEVMLDRDEAEGTFRRHIPVEEVGFDTPYVFWHPQRPYLKVPREDE